MAGSFPTVHGYGRSRRAFFVALLGVVLASTTSGVGLGSVHAVGTQLSTTLLSSSVNPSVYGESVTITATVSGGSGVPTGYVAFYLDNTGPYRYMLDTAGQAQYTPAVTRWETGSPGNPVSAYYEGNQTYAASYAPTLTQVVNTADTETLLTSDHNPAQPGQAITFTAKVSPVAPSVEDCCRGGTVEFRVDGVQRGGLATLDENNEAHSIPISDLSAGTHTVVAHYWADTHHNDSSDQITQVVGCTTVGQLVPNDQSECIATSVVVTGNPNPSAVGEEVTLKAKVTVPGDAADIPDGKVQFMSGTTKLGDPRDLDALGRAFLPRTFSAVGSHSIQAIYSGDPTHAGATSPAYAHTVARMATTTVVEIFPGVDNPSVRGQPVSFIATVQTQRGVTVDGGTVQFKRDGQNFGPPQPFLPTLGVFVSPAMTDLTVGIHNIRAVYKGNEHFRDSPLSAAYVQTVNPAETQVTLVGPATARKGTPVGFVATVTVVAPGGGTPVGMVKFKINGHPAGEFQLVNGQASLTKTFREPSTKKVVAIYLGNSQYAKSPPSNTVKHVVTN